MFSGKPCKPSYISIEKLCDIPGGFTYIFWGWYILSKHTNDKTVQIIPRMMAWENIQWRGFISTGIRWQTFSFSLLTTLVLCHVGFFYNILLLPLSFACPSFSERGACLALLYESLTQPSFRTGIKRMARVWRMSHSFHVKDNLWQHLTYTRLLDVVILGPIHAKKCSTLSINKCMLKKYVHVKTSFS